MKHKIFDTVGTVIYLHFKSTCGWDFHLNFLWMVSEATDWVYECSLNLTSSSSSYVLHFVAFYIRTPMLLVCFIMDSSNLLHCSWVESNLGQRLLNYFQHRVGALHMFQNIVNAPHIMCSSESLMNGFTFGSQSRVAVWWYSTGTRYVAFPHLNISENWKPNYKTFPI